MLIRGGLLTVLFFFSTSCLPPKTIPPNNDNLKQEECLSCGKVTGRAPVIPNSSIVTGRVISYEEESTPKSAEGIFYKLRILIEHIMDDGKRPNLLKGKEGSEMTFYTREKMPTPIIGKKVKGTASLKGDEHGAGWWMMGLKIIEEE